MLQVLKPVCLEPMLHSKGSYCSEKPAQHNWREAPLATAREKKALKAKKTQRSQKINIKYVNK